MKKFFFNVLYKSGFLNLVRKSKKSKVTIVSLHKISSTKPNFFWEPITPILFEDLLKYLKKHYNVIKFSQLGAITNVRKPLAIISFDDGYKDFLDNALPLLKKYSICCNQNVVIECLDSGMMIWTEKLNGIFQTLYQRNTADLSLNIENEKFSLGVQLNWIEFYNKVFQRLSILPRIKRQEILANWQTEYRIFLEDSTMMSWDEVKQLPKDLVEIGSHTYSHDILTTISDDNELNKEIFASKERLQNELNLDVEIFALPNGLGNFKIHEMCRKAGYKKILAVSEEANLSLESDFYNRINLINESPAEMFCRIENVHQKIKSVINYGRLRNKKSRN